MKLCASRAFWLVAYPSQGHEMLFDAHIHIGFELETVADDLLPSLSERLDEM